MYSFSLRTVIYIGFVISLSSLYACSSSSWEDAQKADTYDSYHAYMVAHPDGAHIEEAQMRADSSYWHTIKNDSTAEAFKTYLNKFPGGQFRTEAKTKEKKFSPSKKKATQGEVTGSNIIIRSDHTTQSSSAGVVAKEGTVVQILDHYSIGNSSEAILKREVTIEKNGSHINLPEGKAIHILADRNDSVRASFSTSNFGATEASIAKNDVEATSGQQWYKIHTTDGITGWIYGKFLKEL